MLDDVVTMENGQAATLGDRLMAALKFRDLTRTQLCKQIDMSQAMISRITKNHYQSASHKTCEKISDALKISYKWLRFGLGDMLDVESDQVPTRRELSDAEQLKAATVTDKMMVIADFKDRQPYLAIRASSFSGKKIAKPFVMRAENDCHSLGIRNFDLILIDEVERFSGDGAYILSLGQPHLISILTMNFDGTVTLSGSNSKKDVKLNAGGNLDDENIKIVAKVVSKLINFV